MFGLFAGYGIFAPCIFLTRPNVQDPIVTPGCDPRPIRTEGEGINTVTIRPGIEDTKQMVRLIPDTNSATIIISGAREISPGRIKGEYSDWRPAVPEARDQ